MVVEHDAIDDDTGELVCHGVASGSVDINLNTQLSSAPDGFRAYLRSLGHSPEQGRNVKSFYIFIVCGRRCDLAAPPPPGRPRKPPRQRRRRSPKSSTPMSAASTGCRTRSYRFAQALLQLGRQERPDRPASGSSTAPTPSMTPRIATRASRRPTRSEPRDAGARSRRVRLCGRREQARAAAEGGRRLLHPGELQGRPDGQGQGPASAPRRRLGRVRQRRQGAAQQRRSHQRPARGREARRDRAEAKAARRATMSRR